MTKPKPDFVLLISCLDRQGIVAAIASFVAAQDCDIVHNAQFGDRDSGRFFMRVTFTGPAEMTAECFEHGFGPIAAVYDLEWQVHDLSVKQRALVMVSQGGHCLNDLLYRTASRFLPMEVTSVVSNHDLWRRRVEHEGIPYHHLPVTPDTKLAQEERLLTLIEEQRVDLIILARYMQVLSDAACRMLEGRVINIHHSSLPAFKGPRPYHRAWERGVKIVGATAHYVTADLDEGPIIAQDISMVDHADTIEDLIAQGQETESRVLIRAVKAHCEHRVMLNGQRTVVFR